jgi:isopenicillin-N N-acyltransferase like protein
MTLALARARGGARSMGRLQGEAFAPGIAAALAFYRDLAVASGTDLEAVAAQALPYLDAARRSLPDVVEELEGLGEGAAITLEDALVLNCIEEVWPADACTTLVHGPFLLHAEQWYSRHSDIGVVVAEPDDGPAFVSPTCAGFLPAVGVSSAGFAQGIDSLSASDDRIGIPRVLVSRVALGAPGPTAAVAAACTQGRAGGYAHVLAGSQRRVTVETSATRHALIDDVDAHTNHPLSAALTSISPPARPGSSARLERARWLLEHAPPTSLEDCTRILADHVGRPETICLHEEGPDAARTVFGMACDISSGRLLVSDGSPCEGAWEEFAVPSSTAEARRVG